MLPECVPLKDSINQELKNDFKGERSGFVAVGPNRYILPEAYKNHAEPYMKTKLRKDDVWVVTFPRSGTTLCQELTWMINNNLDYEASSKSSLQDRFPFLEVNTLIHDEFIQELIEQNNNPTVTKMLKSWKIPGDKLVEDLPSPRHFKTHLPFSLLPPNLLDTCKTIYVARNPKDVAVSYYHHNRLVRLHDYTNDFKKYWNYFKNDLVVFSPFWKHVEEGWERRNHPNLLFLYYEDMIKDMKSCIIKVASFLNKTITEEQIAKLANHLEINNFRKNVPLMTSEKIHGFLRENGEGFIRKGKIGANQEIDEDINKEADEWIRNNLARNKISNFPL